jgi:hypothetical protein
MTARDGLTPQEATMTNGEKQGWTYTIRPDACWVNANGAIYYVGREHAPLIAAAPDMYEALREVEAIMMTVEPRSDKAEYLAGRQRALAAIAKAEGREGGDHE